MKQRNGCTLVELLAVIVILAIILVIAVPSIMSTIADARKSSYKSSAMMVASAAENQYMISQTLGNCVDSGYPSVDPDATKFYAGSSTAPAPCGSWAGIDANEHGTCTYYIEDNTAHVTLKAPTSGNSKFKNCVATGTKTGADVTGANCAK